MENKDEIKTKILKIFDETDKTKANSIDIKNNIIGNNNTQIKTDKLIVTQKVVNKRQSLPRDETNITEEQSFIIKQLIDEIVDAIYNSKKTKKDKKYIYPEVWKFFKAKFKITEYKKLNINDFNKADNYLKQQRAIYTGRPKFAKEKNDKYRKDMYKAIHALINELEWSNDKYREYLYNNYGVLSSKELDDKKLKNFKNRLQSQAQYRRNKK